MRTSESGGQIIDWRSAIPLRASLPAELPDADPVEKPAPSAAQLFAILHAHGRLALLAAALTLLLGLVLVVLMPRSYSAEASLMVDYDLSNPLNGRELPVDQVSSFIATQIELMRRPEMLAAVAHALPPEDRAQYRRGYKPELGAEDDWIGAQIGKKLQIMPGPSGSLVIYVDFLASNPRRAASVVNTLVDVYEAEERDREIGAPKLQVASNVERLKGASARVTEARAKLDAFEKSHGLHGQSGNATVEAGVLSSLESRLLDARARRSAAEAHLSAGSAGADEQGAALRMGEDARGQLAAKERQIAEMTRNYGDQYPGLQEARAQAAEMRQAVAELAQTGTRNAASGVAAARRLESSLQAQVDAQRGRLAAIGQVEQEAARYWLELESAEHAYHEVLTESYGSESAASHPGHSNVQVMSRASVPLAARSPKVLVLLLAVFGATLMVGLGLPFLLEFRHRRLRCADDLERGLGVPVLATFGAIERLPVQARLK